MATVAPKEFAPGIPKKTRIVPIPTVTEPTTAWKFGLQYHQAEKAGPHFDLRLGDPKGDAHSWKIDKMPEPGTFEWAIRQPTHTVVYMSSDKTIKSGYGKGKVDRVRLEPTEIIKSGKGKLKFHLYKGHDIEEYSLIQMGKSTIWKLVNHTMTRKKSPDLPSSKPNYREISFDKVPARMLAKKPGLEGMAAKIDGGHNTFELMSGKPLRIYSYRPTERKTGLIEHTHKVPQAFETKVPRELHNTILRGELYARDKKTGKPLPSETVGGLLNSNVWLSRERQKVHGHLRAAIFDVVKWRGKNVEKAPYAEKLVMLQEVKRLLPWMEIPETAMTPDKKQKLLDRIATGKHPQTREGVVFWDMAKGVPPVKAKITTEQDVTIKGFQPGEGRLAGKGIGAILYGTTKDPKEVKGKVGTGLSLALREHMHKNPDLYKGKVMKVKSQGAFPSGALRAPRFLQMHLDTLEGGEKVASFDSMLDELTKIASRRGLKSFTPYVDDVVRQIMRSYRKHKEREKRAYSAQNDTGFQNQPHAPAQSSEVDTEGKLRTNDEPNRDHTRRDIDLPQMFRSVPKTKPAKVPLSKLFADQTNAKNKVTRGNFGDEPLGVTRGFRTNSENINVDK